MDFLVRVRLWILQGLEKQLLMLLTLLCRKIIDHAKAKHILELVKPSVGKRSAVFVLNLWMKPIFGFRLAGRREVHLCPGAESVSSLAISKYSFPRVLHLCLYQDLIPLGD